MFRFYYRQNYPQKNMKRIFLAWFLALPKSTVKVDGYEIEQGGQALQVVTLATELSSQQGLETSFCPYHEICLWRHQRYPLILSLFTYAIEVWGSALLKKYLKRIDQFLRRANRYGYTEKEYNMSSLIEERDRALFGKVIKNTEHCLYELLPDKKQRTLRVQNHNHILPQIKTERFKRCFINRCLFNNF